MKYIVFGFVYIFVLLSFVQGQLVGSDYESDIDQFIEGGNQSQNQASQPAPPWTAYCTSRFPDQPNDISDCLSCLQNGSWYDWSSCVMVCTDDACSQKLSECLDDGISPDRCLCKPMGGISLNTNVPFVGNCISLRSIPWSNTTQVTPTTAFPLLMAWLTRIVTTIILIFCFMAIIVGGVLMSMGWADESQHKKGKDLIKHVVIALALLWASGVILRIINPSFFG